MGCLLTKGFGLACGKPTGGIKEIYFGNWTVLDGTITIDPTSGLVTDFADGSVLYRYKLDQQSASYTCTQTYSKENQTSFWTHTVTFKRRGVSQSLINEIYNMTQGKIVVIVRDENDDFFMLGYQRGLDVTGGGGFQSGVALGDMNGIDLILSGDESKPLVQLTDYTDDPFDFVTDENLTIDVD